MAELNIRKAEVLRDGVWMTIRGIDVKAGEIFRLFEPDGTPVKNKAGLTSFKAIKDARVRSDGVWEIQSTV